MVKQIVNKKTNTKLRNARKKRKTTRKKKNTHITVTQRRDILKLPQTAWILYCKQNRQAIIDKHKDIPFGDVCKALSVSWKLLSDDEKVPFYQAQVDDKKRYEDKKANLTREEVLYLRRHRRQKRLARASRPKAPLSAYMLFVTEQRQMICTGLDPRDFALIGRALGRAWAELPDSEREVYCQRAQVARQEYKKLVEAYNAAKKCKGPKVVAPQTIIS